MRRHLLPNRDRGFTLIELLIVIVVISILMAIAVPSYSWAVRKSNRSAAQGCLLEIAQGMEREYAMRMSYAGAALANLHGGCVTELAPRYGFSLPTQTASAYTVRAAPTGDQAGDECGVMTINQRGVKTAAGPADCWK